MLRNHTLAAMAVTACLVGLGTPASAANPTPPVIVLVDEPPYVPVVETGPVAQVGESQDLPGGRFVTPAPAQEEAHPTTG